MTTAYPYAVIKAGDTLFVGGESEIAAVDDQGNCVWTAPVDGAAYGLAAANGRLFVSTDTGAIHCFGNGKPMVASTKKVLRNPFESDVRAIEYKGQVQDILARTGVNNGTASYSAVATDIWPMRSHRQTDDLNDSLRRSRQRAGRCGQKESHRRRCLRRRVRVDRRDVRVPRRPDRLPPIWY